MYSMAVMKFHLISLGCSKNTADSEALCDTLEQKGLVWSSSPEKSDILFVNTCGFIKDAKEQSLSTIMNVLHLKSSMPKLKTVVFGCLVKRYRSEIEEGIPEIDFLFDFMDGTSIKELFKALKSVKPEANYQTRRHFTPKHIGILKIAEGCSNRCAYCAIPGIRGDFKSIEEKSIIETAKQLAKSGAKEISVVAQDITRYGTDRSGKCELPQLIKKLGKIQGIEWIRLHYMHPRNLSVELLDAMYKLPKVVPYFDIPFQHASDRMLRLMKRHTSPEKIKSLIKHVRKNYPTATIRTTFIVGFPGENEEEFQELIDFVEMYPIDRVGAFMYSTEEGTAAAKIVPKVQQAEKQRRLDELMTLQQLIAAELNLKMTGKVAEVIIDEITDGICLGRTMGDAFEIDNITRFPAKSTDIPGKIVKVKILKAEAYDFHGESVE